MRRLQIVCGFALFLLAACAFNQTTRSPTGDDALLPQLTRDPDADKAIGCKQLMDSYCSRLYAPNASGNLLIVPSTLPILAWIRFRS